MCERVFSWSEDNPENKGIVCKISIPYTAPVNVTDVSQPPGPLKKIKNFVHLDPDQGFLSKPIVGLLQDVKCIC
jgi:hypothetical protein